MKYEASLVTTATSKTLRLLHGLGSGVLVGALDEVGKVVTKEWDRNIARGRSEAGKFPALAPGYAAWKKRVAGARPILDLTGAMRASFRPSARHLGGARYEVAIRSVGSASYGKRRVRNIDKARWAIEGAAGGARKGRRVRDFGTAVGLKRARDPVTKAWSRPPRVFTAVSPKVIARVLAKALRAAAR